MITFYKRNRAGNPYYYSIHDRQASLFSDYSFTAIWGRRLSSGREKHYVFEDRNSMENTLVAVMNRKVKDGYKILYKYSREKRYNRIFHDLEQAPA